MRVKLIVLFILLLLPLAAHAATRYASPTGSGSAPCTAISSPCSLTTALGQWGGGGDILYLRQGTYNQVITFAPSNSGVLGNPSLLSSYPGETVTILRGLNFSDTSPSPVVHDITVNGLDMDGSQDNGYDDGIFIYSTGIGNITIQNTITENWTAMGIHGYFATGIVLRNVTARFNGRGCPSFGSDCRAIHGIYGTMPGLLVDGGEFTNNSGYGIQIYNEYGASASNTVIRNARIHHNQGDGGVVLGFGDNIQFYNNLVYNNSGGGIYPFGYGATNGKVYSNTFYGNGGAPVLELGTFGGSGFDVKDNIFANNQQGISDLSGGSVTFLANLCSSSGAGCATVGNALFVNPNSPNYDFHVTSGSPAINAGTTLGAPWNVDLEGNTRPAGQYTDGAFQFSGSPPAAPVFTFSANPNPTPSGTSTMLNWSAVQNDVSSGCTASTTLGSDSLWTSGNPTSAQLIAGGSRNGSTLTGPVTYQMSCTGTGGTTTKTVAVTIGPAPLLGLVALYKCDGNANDSSGNGFNGTIQNSASVTGAPLIGTTGNACVFNGVNQSITGPNDAHFRPANVSLTAWLKTATPSAGNCHLMGTRNAMAYDLGYTNAGVPFFSINGTQTVSGSASIVNNTTHLLGSTYDGTIMRLWMDNANVASFTPPAGTTISYSGSEVLAMGGDTGAFCNATMDNMRLYDHALTSAEMQAIFAEQTQIPAMSTTMPNMTWTVADAVEGKNRCPGTTINCDLTNNILYPIGFRGEIRHTGNTLTEAFKATCRTDHGGSYGAWTALSGSLGTLGVKLHSDTTVHMGDSTSLMMLPTANGFLTVPGRIIAAPLDSGVMIQMADSQRAEVETRIELGAPLVNGDHVQCRYEHPASAFDAYGPTSPPDSFATLTVSTAPPGHPSSLTLRGLTTR